MKLFQATLQEEQCQTMVMPWMAVVSNKNGGVEAMPDVAAKLLVLEKSSSRSVITELLLLHLF